MQYNKQHGSAAVCFAPCAVVEKPHEGLWVLKDKPWLAGRESVMQQKTVFFTLFFLRPPFNFFLNPLFSTPHPRVLSFTKFSLLLCPHFFPSSFISFILRHIRLKITAGMPSQRRGWTWSGGREADQRNQLRRRLR